MSTTAQIVVGYTATSTGQDALHLGIALARNRDSHIHLVMVAPTDSPYVAARGVDAGAEASYMSIRDSQISTWLAEAAAQVPPEIPVTTHLVAGHSAPAELLRAADDLHASVIVTGSRAGGLLRRHVLGSMSSHLLHSADVPVALAPTGFHHPGPVGRVTAMFGRNHDLTDVIGESVATARSRGVSLRLVSLAPLEDPTRDTTDAVLNELEEYANSRLAAEAAELVEENRASTVIARGQDITDAVSNLDFAEDELILVASSRMAPRGRLFLGSTAAKMLHVAPVPVVIVPSGYATGAPS